jgi:tetratricopeptide (TPR) repeat protein
VGISLYNLADVYREMKEYEKAGEYYKQSSIISAKLGDREGLLLCTQATAELLVKQGDIHAASSHLQQSLIYARELERKKEIQEITDALEKLTPLKNNCDGDQ